MTLYPFRMGWWAFAPAGARWQSAARRTMDPHTAHKTRGGSAGYCSWSEGPAFGVRRPLRYLAFKLDLTEAQIRDFADVLNRLKTARGQSRLDWERSVADAADAFAAEGFDEAKAKDALARRTRSSEVLNDELVNALKRIHTILHEDQRKEFAYLLRSGGLAI